MKADVFITEILSWRGTPFKDNVMIKSFGCDCLHLIVGALKEIGELVQEPDVEFLSRGGKYPMARLVEQFAEVGWSPVGFPLRRADILIKKAGRRQICVSVVVKINKEITTVISSWMIVGVLTRNWTQIKVCRNLALILRKKDVEY